MRFIALSTLSLAILASGSPFPSANVDSLIEERSASPAVAIDHQASGFVVEKRATAATYFTALVAFGASYTDNAHARASQYSGSLRNYYPYSNYGGRYSNGKVAVEYMVASGTSPGLARSGTSYPKLIDYAYGGSMIDNSLTYGSSPASKDQVAQYLSDLSAGSISVGAGKVLHYINSGINPVTAIWTTAINAGSTTTAVNNAKAAVSANVKAIATQMRSINTNKAIASKVHGVDFVIVGIPPLEIVPTFSYQAGGDAKKLALLKTLTAQFNSELASFAGTLRGESKNGRVMLFDLASLWRDFHANPSKYGITVSVTSTCYNSSTGSVCSNPQNYLYFDSLHPVTSIHKVVASKINNLIKNTA